jgi:chaperonin GroEL (HSP60 family)
MLTYMQAKHASGNHSWGINGNTGKVEDMKTYGLYESASVKVQTFKTAIEVSPSLPSVLSALCSWEPVGFVRLTAGIPNAVI